MRVHAAMRVVERLPLLPRALGRRRRQLEIGQRRAQIETRPPTTIGLRPAARTSSIAANASRWNSATETSCSRSKMPTRRAG